MSREADSLLTAGEIEVQTGDRASQAVNVRAWNQTQICLVQTAWSFPATHCICPEASNLICARLLALWTHTSVGPRPAMEGLSLLGPRYAL